MDAAQTMRYPLWSQEDQFWERVPDYPLLEIGHFWNEKKTSIFREAFLRVEVHFLGVEGVALIRKQNRKDIVNLFLGFGMYEWLNISEGK